MDEVKKGRLPAAILLLTLIVGLLAAGCGQKEMEPPKHELAGKELAELSAWPERETYDEAFHDSRNATLALWTQTCSCGAEGISCRQSYTEASLGASAVRECPLGQMPAKDNQMTEEYAESFYCPSCGKQELAFATKDIWLYRTPLGVPHYHLAETDSPAQYWCKIFADDEGQSWVYIYEGTNGVGEPLEKCQLEREDNTMETLSHLLVKRL